jgi:hypothetical protein
MNKLLYAPALISFLIVSAWTFTVNGQTISWKLQDPNLVGGFKPDILGKPSMKVRRERHGDLF